VSRQDLRVSGVDEQSGMDSTGRRCARDFFSVEVLGVFGTARYMVFIVMCIKTRAVQIAGVRIAPDGDWMKQIARNLLDPVDGFLRNASHLIHDRDPVFTQAWTVLLKTCGVTLRIRPCPCAWMG